MPSSSATDPSPYVVVIGDVVESRELTDRASAQDELRSVIDVFNRERDDALAAPLKLTGGDEMKTLLEDPVLAVDVIVQVTEAAHPIALAWGIGRGPLATSWVPDVGELDGPCFHRARRAIEAASADKAWARASGFSEVDDVVVSALFRLLGSIRSSWTDKQRTYVRSVRRKSQRATAKELGVTEGAISHSLRSARFHDVEEGEEALRRLLASYRRGRPRPDRPARTEPGGG